MNYPLEQVLKIRSLREKTALARTQQAQQKVREAVEYLDDRKNKLVECRDALCRQEEMLVENVIKRKISVSEFETLQGKLHGMKTIEMRCRQDVNVAADNVKDTKKFAERIKAEFFIVAKQRKKLDEHYQIWREMEKINSEKALDEDLDEFAIQCRI